ncbi:hypothetical protein QUB25_17275 [Microcoleus sp. B3-D7]
MIELPALQIHLKISGDFQSPLYKQTLPGLTQETLKPCFAGFVCLGAHLSARIRSLSIPAETYL